MPFWFPLIAHADGSGLTIVNLMYRISYYIINPLIKLGFIVAIVYFLWGIVQYIRDKNAGSIVGKAGAKGGGGSHILWGLLGLLIMTSAFAIMALLKTWLGSDIATP